MELLNSIGIVIFDNDGVLIDSWAATIYFFNTLRQTLNLPELTPAEEQFCFAATLQEGIKGTLPNDLHAKAMAVANTIGPEALIPRIRRQDQALDFLLLLEQLEIKTAVMTNGGSESRLLLQSVGLLDHFSQVVTADDVTHAKPSGEGLRLILAKNEIDPNQALFIGDSQQDHDAAKNAGVRFWAYNNPKLVAEHHIAGFAEAIQQFNCSGTGHSRSPESPPG